MWILNTFTHFWCFLEHFYWKFILNINNEHVQDYSCPGATFAFCSHGKKLPQQGGLPGVVQWVTHLSKLPRGNEKLMWTVTGVRPSTKAKLIPAGSVSCPGQWVVLGSCEQALNMCKKLVSRLRLQNSSKLKPNVAERWNFAGASFESTEGSLWKKFGCHSIFFIWQWRQFCVPSIFAVFVQYYTL